MTITPLLVVISFLIAAVIAAVAAFFVVRSYSMKHKPVEYPFKDFTQLDLQEQRDVFVGRNVTSRVIESSSNRKR